ncbi:MAG: hypothetical protein VX000_06710 [Myxococcota bacterium]|nr:hypothetical protein [Myxococcota bacterium]
MRWTVVRFWATLGAGCAGDPLPLDGAWALTGTDVRGVLRATSGRGCSDGRAEIGLWGPGFGTPGIVGAGLVEEAPGEVWAYFPLRTGVGEGEAALRIEGTAGRLPLGARPAEHDVHLRLEQRVPDAAELESISTENRTRLDAAEAAWQAGAFTLRDGDALVGEIRLRGPDAAPLVAVYDETWLSAGLVEADRADEGADLLLAFPVEPNLGGEKALLRINVPTGAVVVPTGAVPDAMDRRLRLLAGEVPGDVRAARVRTAREAARQTEHTQLLRLLPQLAGAARRSDGVCMAPAAVDPVWPLLLAGYSTRIVSDGDGCLVEVEASPEQHGRRFRGAVGTTGLVEGSGALGG